jgi:glycosyltransferase involved in cell wall biosynthesis
LKVLLVNTLYAPNVVGGTEGFVQTLAEGLENTGHRAVVVSTSPQKGVSTGTIAGVKVYYVGLKNLYWPFKDKKNRAVFKPLAHAIDTFNPWMAREVERILELERPDLVHTNGLSGFSVLAWQSVKRRRLPLVHTLHDHYLLCPRSTMFHRGKNCERRCVECVLYASPREHYSNRVDAVVGVSRFILERHLRYGYFGRVSTKRVIPNPYQAESPARKPYGVHSLPIRFGYLGQLNTNKGIELLLDNISRLREGTWRLSVAGRGLNAYESYLHEGYVNPAIRFLGYTRPAAFFSGTDVLVIPSLLRESFGRVIIEAYAYGVPVIGSNRGGVPELIEEGRTGFLFNPDLPEELVERAERFIDRPSTIDEMRDACLRKAGGFLPRSVTETYLDLYAEVVEAIRGECALRG